MLYQVRISQYKYLYILNITRKVKVLISTRSLIADKIIHTVSIISSHPVALGGHSDAVKWAGYIGEGTCAAE